MDDQDSPWKEALDEFFQPFVSLLFPTMHAGIDWSRGFVFLDKELQQIVPDAERGRRIVDKLVKVWRVDGAEEWVLVHIEVQGHRKQDFLERMYLYHCHLTARYNRRVVSVAVLADQHPAWRPQHFQWSLWNFEIDVRFPISKLLDFADRAEELGRSQNPFARFVVAYLKALETRKDEQSRFAWKVQLIQELLVGGLERPVIHQLLRLIDWVLKLPPTLERKFRDDIIRFQQERKMPFVTSFERLAREEGRQEGRQEGREEAWEEARELALRLLGPLLEARFGETGAELMAEIETIHDQQLLKTIVEQASRAPSAEALRRCWKNS